MGPWACVQPGRGHRGRPSTASGGQAHAVPHASSLLCGAVPELFAAGALRPQAAQLPRGQHAGHWATGRLPSWPGRPPHEVGPGPVPPAAPPAPPQPQSPGPATRAQRTGAAASSRAMGRSRPPGTRGLAAGTTLLKRLLRPVLVSPAPSPPPTALPPGAAPTSRPPNSAHGTATLLWEPRVWPRVWPRGLLTSSRWGQAREAPRSTEVYGSGCGRRAQGPSPAGGCRSGAPAAGVEVQPEPQVPRPAWAVPRVPWERASQTPAPHTRPPTLRTHSHCLTRPRRGNLPLRLVDPAPRDVNSQGC